MGQTLGLENRILVVNRWTSATDKRRVWKVVTTPEHEEEDARELHGEWVKVRLVEGERTL